MRACRRAIAALVTAPLHKGILNDAGIAFTSYRILGRKSGTGQVVMMLAGGGLRRGAGRTTLQQGYRAAIRPAADRIGGHHSRQSLPANSA